MQRDAAGYSLPVEVLHLGEAFYVVAVSPAKRYELVRHDTGAGRPAWCSRGLTAWPCSTTEAAPNSTGVPGRG
jgi:hypothetical protein